MKYFVSDCEKCNFGDIYNFRYLINDPLVINTFNPDQAIKLMAIYCYTLLRGSVRPFIRPSVFFLQYSGRSATLLKNVFVDEQRRGFNFTKQCRNYGVLECLPV